ncbi:MULTISPECIES: YlaI family protein [unclassified Virgibacillus]|uniref:YlaI family protein n=1 Tax=unclassified Virgibacillus TaxID=2620237 RepID=UPI0024DE88F4|nr:YlaI family protein [Virgibacillus sp. LDC-1]
MQVKCVLCDQIEGIEDNSLQAKRLRNRKISMYLCATCDNRIKVSTLERHASGNFKLYQEEKEINGLI